MGTGQGRKKQEELFLCQRAGGNAATFLLRAVEPVLNEGASMRFARSAAAGFYFLPPEAGPAVAGTGGELPVAADRILRRVRQQAGDSRVLVFV